MLHLQGTCPSCISLSLTKGLQGRLTYLGRCHCSLGRCSIWGSQSWSDRFQVTRVGTVPSRLSCLWMPPTTTSFNGKSLTIPEGMDSWVLLLLMTSSGHFLGTENRFTFYKTRSRVLGPTKVTRPPWWDQTGCPAHVRVLTLGHRSWEVTLTLLLDPSPKLLYPGS